MNKLSRYYHTLKHLKPIQIRYQVWYRLRNRFFPVDLPVIHHLPDYRKLVLHPFPDQHTHYLGNKHFRFLNLDQIFKEKINWNYKGHGKLWTYHLNYFEYLHQPDMDTETGLKLIRDFISKLECRSEGLDPYPISLRTINWIKFMIDHNTWPEDLIQSLYTQYDVLSKKIEYHLLGNHLLENGFSMLFGAVLFQDQKFTRIAKKILTAELEEQILSDGAHAELSPAYHCMLLQRALDGYNLLTQNEHCLEYLEKQLEEVIPEMVNWLHTITFQNDELPMVNDSIHGHVLSPKQLRDYARKLGFNTDTCQLSESGYRKFEKGHFELFTDVGEIGLSYQPGHVHSDTFSFVLHHRGKPLIVDKGVSTYEKNSLRQEERGTASHNTVMVNAEEQSDVWSGFRVGRRASTRILEESGHQLVATHDGYRHIGITHTRSWKITNNKVVIFDSIDGGNVLCEAYLHFHPLQKVKKIDDQLYMADGLKIELQHAEHSTLETYKWAAGMNRVESAKKIKIKFLNKLETIISS